MSRIVLGTRGSDLARAQTSLVEVALRAAHPELDVAIEVIRTWGDEGSGRVPATEARHAGRKGIFTAEIERALLDRRIDAAVHSAKDLPSDPTADLETCAVLPRASVEDVLIAKEVNGLSALPHGATVASGSVRRQHQLRYARGDLNIIDLRGNVPTRLRKLMTNAWDAIILARAGLERLGFDCASGELAFEQQKLHTSVLPTDQFLPAGGQGIVALQIRSDDDEARHVISPINDSTSFLCLRAEREFLRLLQGDCETPVGVLAMSRDGRMEIGAQIFDEGSTQPRGAALRKEKGTRIEPEAVAAELFDLINGREE